MHRSYSRQGHCNLSCSRKILLGVHIVRYVRPAPIRSRLVCSAARDGPSGLNVGGHRPTTQKGWDQMRAELKKANVHMISPQEATFAEERGAATIVDVRPEDLFLNSHIPRAKNVPFFRPIEGWEPWKIVRRAGFLLFGIVNGTEPNPTFAADVAALTNKETEVILYCSMGGSLEDNQAQRALSQTRSVMAAYELVKEGFTNVVVLKGGFAEWRNSGRAVEGAQGGAVEEETQALN